MDYLRTCVKPKFGEALVVQRVPNVRAYSDVLSSTLALGLQTYGLKSNYPQITSLDLISLLK